MSKHKKQHYIPNSYLKAWCDLSCQEGQEPYVWIISKVGDEIRRKAPAKIFTETDIYTVKFSDGGRDLRFEKGLGQMEGRFVDIRRKEISKCSNMGPEERAIICVFAAAMFTRTPTNRDHWKSQWGKAREMMESMIEWKNKATPQEVRNAVSLSSYSKRDAENSLSYEDIKDLHKNPMEQLLSSQIGMLAPEFARMDLAILCTNDDIGFIASDQPCVWHDPEAYKRPPFYRGPALMYETIEITLPISPQQLVLFNRQGITGYIPVKSKHVDAVNNRTRFYSNKHIVINKKVKKDVWFEVGEAPNDSWEKIHNKAAGDVVEKNT